MAKQTASAAPPPQDSSQASPPAADAATGDAQQGQQDGQSGTAAPADAATAAPTDPAPAPAAPASAAPPPKEQPHNAPDGGATHFGSAQGTHFGQSAKFNEGAFCPPDNPPPLDASETPQGYMQRLSALGYTKGALDRRIAEAQAAAEQAAGTKPT